MALTKVEIEHIATLARIKLAEKEKTHLTTELGAILEYINKLNEIDTTTVEPTAQVTGLENIFRADNEPLPAGQSEKLIKQFPEQKDGFLKVGSVFTTSAET